MRRTAPLLLTALLAFIPADTGAQQIDCSGCASIGSLSGNLTFTANTNHQITVSASTGTTVTGGALLLQAAAGSVATGGSAGGVGGQAKLRGGTGGAAAGGAGAGGLGGASDLQGGTGGAGTATGAAGAGGDINITAGTAGANGGAGGANGGSVYIDGGGATGAGTSGTVYLGATTNTTAIEIGENAFNTTTVVGEFVCGSTRTTQSAITVTASPFTYTNSDNQQQQIHIFAGTVSDIAIIRNSTTTTIRATTNATVILSAGDAVKVTYTGAPTMIKVPF